MAPKEFGANAIELRKARSTLNALAASSGLSLLFLVVYGGCNWITSHRDHVGSFYLQWERGIPFVPFFIIPYLSIDLFFVMAPFICRDNAELRIFSKRVAAAILIAGICFLLFPLRFAFPRPSAAGWAGALFDWFRAMDAPYNLVPSLHAALLLLLADVYARNLTKFARWAVLAWFVLIALSPLFTYQHHIVDLIGGFVLAGYCFYFFRANSFSLPVLVHRRIGFTYLAGAAAAAILFVIFWPWGALLLWPAIALAIMAGAYFGLGPAVFRKAKGRLPWSARFVLAPCLLGHYFSLLYYRRQCRPWDEVTPRVWIGGKLGDHSVDKALRSGITSVLDLTAEFSEAGAFRKINYRNVPILDLTAPTQVQLSEMVAFINDQSRDGVVYVHCKIGYSRSAAAIGAWLLASGRATTAREAFAIIRRARPSVIVRPEVASALSEFESNLVHSSEIVSTRLGS